MAENSKISWTDHTYNPALGPVDFDGLFKSMDVSNTWLICGGESGHGRRTFAEEWARSARDHCQEFGIPFFYKQKIEDGKKIENPTLDGRKWMERP